MTSCAWHLPERARLKKLRILVSQRAARFAACGALCVLGSWLLAGCGAEQSPLQESVKDCIYRFEQIDLTGDTEDEGGGCSCIGNLYLSSKGICTVVNRYGPMGEGDFLVCSPTDGSGTDEIQLFGGTSGSRRTPSLVLEEYSGEEAEVPAQEAEASGEERRISLYCGDGDKLYGVAAVRHEDPLEGMILDRWELLELSPSGEIFAAHEIPAKMAPASGELYIEALISSGNGRLILKSNDGLIAYDSGSDQFRKIYTSPNGWYDPKLCTLADGTVLVGSWEDGGYVLRTLDAASGTFSDPLEIPADIGGRMLFAGRTHDVYYFSDHSIYAYDRRGGRSVKVMDGLASDLLVDDVGGILELEDGRLALMTSEWSDDGQKMYIVLATHVPPSEVKDKTEITLSCVWLDSTITRRVVEFNRSSEDYRIRIVDYSRYASDSDWRAPYTKLNTDLVAGNIPDILVIDSELPVESYISKGILADITPFIENDPELSRVDFLDNIFDAYRVDGCLYQLIPSYIIYTGAIFTKDLDGRTTLTMRDLNELCREKDIPVKNSFGQMVRSNIFSMLLYMQGAEYVDLSTGRCAFDSQEFRDFLELVGQFPEKEEDTNYAEMQKAFREGRAIVQITGLSQFKDYVNLRYGTFGDDITLIGIPGSSGSGSVILPGMQIGITTSAKDPEAVWSFVRELLLPEYQDNLNWAFPVREDSLRKKAEKDKERPYYIDETGKKVEYDETFWIAGAEIPIPPISDEEIETMIDFIKGCDRRVYNNSTVSNIIQEESAAYFDNQKDVDEVVKIIQSRAQIYVHENR